MSKPMLLTRRMLAAEAATLFSHQYPEADRMAAGILDWRERAYQALLALGPSPDPDAVDQAIGNGSWTRLMCDACGAYVDAAVRVGAEPDWDSATATLCDACVRAAFALLTPAPGTETS